MKIIKNILLLIAYVVIVIPALILMLFFVFLIALIGWSRVDDVEKWKINDYFDDVCEKLTFYLKDDYD